jgi:endonuclease/exonuclease/phosphatase family metal-dependent hydrolase
MSLRLVRSLCKTSLLTSACLLSYALTASAQTLPTEISITTFNIKYYGLNGDHDGEPGSEVRDNTIKAHLNKYELWTDVVVFQEIVDVPGLQSLMGSGYLCRSYDNEDPRHQHVVICHKKKFAFRMAKDEDNYILDDVAMSRYRPVVHGILTYRNKPMLHVMGVHLKAQPDRSDVRTEQTHMIAEYLTHRENSEPVVIIGDFNTHNDDAEVMNGIYKHEDIDLVQVTVPQEFTYRVPQHGAKLDRIWVSRNLRVSQKPKVAGPCNSVATSTDPIRTYNTEVSDHCPVTLKVAPKQTTR